MRVLREWLQRLARTVMGGRRDAGLDETLRLHHEMAADEARRRGEHRGVPFIDTAIQDLRYSVRTLRRAPVFAIAVTLTLAVGIGATTSVFSLINSLLLRALPVAEPHRLATISSESSIAHGLMAGPGWNYAMWSRLHARADAFDGAFVWIPRRLNLGRGGEMEPVDGLFTTSDFFKTLGVRAMLGRTFTIDDDGRGGGPDGPVTVISHAFWQRHLAGATGVIGTPLLIEHVPFTIVGVTPPGFAGVEAGRPFDLALTFGTEPMVRQGAAIDQPAAYGLIPMVRLKPGQRLSEATAVMRVLQAGILGSEPVPPSLQEPFVLVPSPNGTSSTERGMSGLRQQYGRPLLTVFVIVGLLLAIACANIAHLLLVRGIARRQELSVRRALGASRGRLVQQLLIESLVLGIVGALGALLLAEWMTKALVGQMSTMDSRVGLDVTIDWRVLAFTTAVTMLAVVMFGAAPAFSVAREASLDTLKGQKRAARRLSQRGTTGGLVVAQVALSLVLLVSAGLFVQTLWRLTAVPLGFDRDDVLLVTVDTMRASVPAGARVSLYARLVTAVSGLPNVDHAAASAWVPISGGSGQLEVNSTAPARQMALFNFVSPDWFATYGTRVVAGRDFDDRDSANAAPVVIVNETLARALFPNNPDPVGERVGSRAPNWEPRTVIGVVGDAVSHVLGMTPQASTVVRRPVAPTLYIPLAQSEGMAPPGMTRVTIGVRTTTASPSQLAASIGAAITTVDSNVAFGFRPLADVVSTAFAQERLVAVLGGCFGALALGLAVIGLYGVSAYAVSQRRAEIAVRMALGAAPRGIVRLILRRVAILVALGVVEGTVLSIWVAPFGATLLYGLAPNDLTTLGGAILILSVAGLAAGWLPARSAARIDPIEVLRET